MFAEIEAGGGQGQVMTGGTEISAGGAATMRPSIGPSGRPSRSAQASPGIGWRVESPSRSSAQNGARVERNQELSLNVPASAAQSASTPASVLSRVATSTVYSKCFEDLSYFPTRLGVSAEAM